MKNKQDYYQLLHVQPDAPREIIRSSYRTMMQRMRMHPDLGGDNEQAAAVNEAYAVLMEPSHRAAYDKSRQQQPRNNTYSKPEAAATERPTAALNHCAFCHTHSEETLPDALCGHCKSPLFLARQPDCEDSDRRSILRVHNDHPVVFCTHWPQSEPHVGRTDDLSLTGLRLRAQAGLAIGQIIKLDSEILHAVAQVTRSQYRGTIWEIGVQFVSLSFEQSRGSFIVESV